MSAETKVDVRGLLRELPELLVIASTDPSSDRLIGVALRIRETESAVAELIEAAQEFFDAQREIDNHELHGPNAQPYEQLIRRKRRAYSEFEAALARIGGAV